MSLNDFKNIINYLEFSSAKYSQLCISCKNGEIYFKMILEDKNISTLYLNEHVIIDCTDILLMFDYKLINDIICKSLNGTIKFSLNKNKITMKIIEKYELNLYFYNSVNEEVLGELQEADFLKVDSTLLYNVLNYFVKYDRNMSNLLYTSYINLQVKDKYIIIENEPLSIKIPIQDSIYIRQFKLHIDYLFKFLSCKKLICNIYLHEDFPLVCKCDTEYGKIELWSSPVT
jgi:hypothetical protein